MVVKSWSSTHHLREEQGSEMPPKAAEGITQPCSVPLGSACCDGSSWSSIQESFTFLIQVFWPQLVVGMKWVLE